MSSGPDCQSYNFDSSWYQLGDKVGLLPSPKLGVPGLIHVAHGIDVDSPLTIIAAFFLSRLLSVSYSTWLVAASLWHADGTCARIAHLCAYLTLFLIIMGLWSGARGAPPPVLHHQESEKVELDWKMTKGA